MLTALLASSLFALAPLAASIRPAALPTRRPPLVVAADAPWHPPTPAAELAPLPPVAARRVTHYTRPGAAVLAYYWAADAPMAAMLAALGWE